MPREAFSVWLKISLFILPVPNKSMLLSLDPGLDSPSVLPLLHWPTKTNVWIFTKEAGLMNGECSNADS